MAGMGALLEYGGAGVGITARVGSHCWGGGAGVGGHCGMKGQCWSEGDLWGEPPGPLGVSEQKGPGPQAGTPVVSVPPSPCSGQEVGALLSPCVCPR